MLTDKIMVCHGIGILFTPRRKPPRGAYRKSIVSELIATITSVCPSFPLARYPHISTIAVQGAKPSRIAPDI